MMGRTLAIPIIIQSTTVLCDKYYYMYQDLPAVSGILFWLVSFLNFAVTAATAATNEVLQLI